MIMGVTVGFGFCSGFLMMGGGLSLFDGGGGGLSLFDGGGGG